MSGNWQDIFSIALELIVTVCVSALVWITLVAGLYQLVSEGIRQISLVSPKPTWERYVQRTEAGPQVAQPQPTAGH